VAVGPSWRQAGAVRSVRSFRHDGSPNPRAQRLVQRKRQFFALSGLLFAVAIAVLVWTVTSSGTAGYVVVPLLVALAIISLLLPVGVGNYIEDYEQGRPQPRQGLWSPVVQLLSGLVLVALQVLQLSASPREDVDTIRWITLVAGAVLTISGLAQLAVIYRRKLHRTH
jgi:hypothetical protein